jgi:hypothetical protein
MPIRIKENAPKKYIGFDIKLPVNLTTIISSITLKVLVKPYFDFPLILGLWFTSISDILAPV